MLVSGYRSSRIRRIQIAHFAFHTCFSNFCGQNGKSTIDRADKKYKKEKQTRKTGIQASISFQKINLHRGGPAPIKQLVLLGCPSCRPLSLLRITHELLAHGGLLSSRSCLFFVVVYPNVLLVKQRRLLIRACEILIQRPIHTGFKRRNFFLHLRCCLRCSG